jgi:hypothetical protein
MSIREPAELQSSPFEPRFKSRIMQAAPPAPYNSARSFK